MNEQFKIYYYAPAASADGGGELGANFSILGGFNPLATVGTAITQAKKEKAAAPKKTKVVKTAPVKGRAVTISGTLQYQEYYGEFESWKNAVSDEFKRQGWVIQNIILKNANTILARESITIKAVVYNNMSLDEIATRARNLLLNMTNTRIFKTYKVFDDVRLEAVEGMGAGGGENNPSGGNGGGGGGGNNPSGGNGDGGNGGGNQKSWWDTIKDELGITQLSTTTTVVAVALIGIIIAKR